jgi:hypothetical protein
LTDVFEEVEESLRQDKASVLWKKWAPYVIGGCVLLIGSVGAFELWRWQQDQQIETQAVAYAGAMTDIRAGKMEEAAGKFAAIAEGKGGFAVLAGHMQAAALKEAGGDQAAVVAALTNAAQKDDGYYGELATLKAAYEIADTATLAELEAAVAPLVAKGGRLSALAREVVAAKALAEGDVERARREFQTLSLDIDAPPNMAARVQRVIAGLPAPAAPPAVPAAEEAAPAPAPEPTDGQATP